MNYFQNLAFFISRRPQMPLNLLYIVAANTSRTNGAPTMDILEDQSYNLVCNCLGIPTPSINWLFNNHITRFTSTEVSLGHTAASTVSRKFNVDTGNVTSTLHLISVRYPDDQGVYTCRGSNIAGSSIITFAIRVIGKIISSSNPVTRVV